MKVKQQEEAYIGIDEHETVTMDKIMQLQHVILQQQD